MGLAIVWFVSFWVAGTRPALALLLAAWSVYWALSEPIGLEWAAYGAVLTVFCAVVALATYA